MLLEGLFTASITPFNSQGQLDEEGLKQHLQLQLKHKVDGIVVLGTTGEAPTLSAKETEQIIRIAAEEIKGKALFLVGTGTYSTEQTIERTKQAKELGADAALIIGPYYNRPSQEGLYRHFKAIAEAVSLPICVYNNQGRTGQNIHTATLERIARLPHIVSVKEASGNIQQMTDVIEMAAGFFPHFSVVSGDDSLTLPLMALGGQGIISVVSNLIPGPMRELVDACRSGNYSQAQTLHYRLLPFFKATFMETNPVPIKAAMNVCGLPAGPCRLPLCSLLPDNQKKIETLLQQLPKEWLLHG